MLRKKIDSEEGSSCVYPFSRGDVHRMRFVSSTDTQVWVTGDPAYQEMPSRGDHRQVSPNARAAQCGFRMEEAGPQTEMPCCM